MKSSSPTLGGTYSVILSQQGKPWTPKTTERLASSWDIHVIKKVGGQIFYGEASQPVIFTEFKSYNS